MKRKPLQLKPMREVLAGCNVQEMHIPVIRQPNDRGNLGCSTKGVPSNGCIFCNG